MNTLNTLLRADVTCETSPVPRTDPFSALPGSGRERPDRSRQGPRPRPAQGRPVSAGGRPRRTPAPGCRPRRTGRDALPRRPGFLCRR